jgi:hypothetical protein
MARCATAIRGCYWTAASTREHLIGLTAENETPNAQRGVRILPF